MKRDYMKKKKITITTLSVVAICLAVGLFYYMGNMKNEMPIAATPLPQQTEEKVVVPEIENPVVTPTVTPSDQIVEEETELNESENIDKVTDKNSEKETEENIDNVIETNPIKPSDDKPRTKEEAIPPTDNTPPVVTDDGKEEEKVVEPNKPVDDTPQGGEVREDGAIYMPGFGWIPYEGENTTIPAPNAGTGEIIGDM